MNTLNDRVTGTDAMFVPMMGIALSLLALAGFIALCVYILKKGKPNDH